MEMPVEKLEKAYSIRWLFAIFFASAYIILTYVGVVFQDLFCVYFAVANFIFAFSFYEFGDWYRKKRFENSIEKFRQICEEFHEACDELDKEKISELAELLAGNRTTKGENYG